MIVRLFKQCCRSTGMDGTEDEAIIESQGENDDEVDANDIHLGISKKIRTYDLDNKCGFVSFSL